MSSANRCWTSASEQFACEQRRVIFALRICQTAPEQIRVGSLDQVLLANGELIHEALSFRDAILGNLSVVEDDLQFDGEVGREVVIAAKRLQRQRTSGTRTGRAQV